MEHTASTRLDEKTVIVTGGSRGIGLSIAQAVADAGANVVVASRKQEGVDEAAEAIGSTGGSVLAVAAHMGDPAAVAGLFEKARAEFGSVDGLVNNAATNPYFGPMLAIEEAAFDKTIEVNVKGPLTASREFAKQGSPGSIVNIASIAGMRAAPLQGVYGMTKAALISMTQTLSHELGGVGIRVNAICPDWLKPASLRLSSTTKRSWRPSTTSRHSSATANLSKSPAPPSICFRTRPAS